MKDKLWQDWANLVLGIWLFLSPWFGLGDVPSAAWNSWIFGVLIAALAWAALSLPKKWEEWTNLVLGVWLIMAPFVLSFTSQVGATWNHVAVGLLVAVVALLALQAPLHRSAAAHT